jgi:hypothetical protein
MVAIRGGRFDQETETETDTEPQSPPGILIVIDISSIIDGGNAGWDVSTRNPKPIPIPSRRFPRYRARYRDPYRYRWWRYVVGRFDQDPDTDPSFFRFNLEGSGGLVL